MKSVVFLKRHLQFNTLYLLSITNAGMTGNIYCYRLGNQQQERQREYLLISFTEDLCQKRKKNTPEIEERCSNMKIGKHLWKSKLIWEAC